MYGQAGLLGTYLHDCHSVEHGGSLLVNDRYYIDKNRALSGRLELLFRAMHHIYSFTAMPVEESDLTDKPLVSSILQYQQDATCYFCGTVRLRAYYMLD